MNGLLASYRLQTAEKRYAEPSVLCLFAFGWHFTWCQCLDTLLAPLPLIKISNYSHSIGSGFCMTRCLISPPYLLPAVIFWRKDTTPYYSHIRNAFWEDLSSSLLFLLLALDIKPHPHTTVVYLIIPSFNCGV